MSKTKVYIYTNKINNKKYCGITKNSLEKRMQCGYTGRFTNALNKYGLKSFTVEVIAEFNTKEEAGELEKQIIKEYNLNDDKYGYNIAKGGDGGNTTKNLSSEKYAQWKNNMSKARQGNKNGNYGKGLFGDKNGRAKGVRVVYPNGDIKTYKTQKECRKDLNIGLDMFINTLKSNKPLELKDAVKDKHIINRYKSLIGIKIENI